MYALVIIIRKQKYLILTLKLINNNGRQKKSSYRRANPLSILLLPAHYYHCYRCRRIIWAGYGDEIFSVRRPRTGLNQRPKHGTRETFLWRPTYTV